MPFMQLLNLESMTPNFIAGFLSGAALIIAIGAQNSFVLRQGIRREYVLPIVLVCASADALLIGAGIVGLGVLIQSVPFLLKVTRYGGSAFLLAYGLIAARRALQPHLLTVDSGVGTSYLDSQKFFCNTYVINTGSLIIILLYAVSCACRSS